VARYLSFVHGTSLVVESPEALTRNERLGWGADVDVGGGKETWFHIALPVPAIVSDAPVAVSRVFLLFSSDFPIRDVHVYDGARKIKEFSPGLGGPSGNLLYRRLPWNTFELGRPHTVQFGLGLSFFVIGSVFTGGPGAGPENRLIVGAAGAEFGTSSFLFWPLGFINALLGPLLRRR
jgi:hypothetical protein